MHTYQSYRLDWDGIEIEIRYCADWAPYFRSIYGHDLAHIEVESLTREPLPITETGYRSHFTRPENVEAAGGPASFVQSWIEDEAQRKDWKEFEDAARQLALF